MAFPPKLITNYQSAATHQQQADEIIAGHARSAGAGEGVGFIRGLGILNPCNGIARMFRVNRIGGVIVRILKRIANIIGIRTG